MLSVCLMLVATSFFIRETDIDHVWLLFAIVFLFGGCAFTLYPLSISHMCDLIAPSKVVEASQGLLVFYGVGAVTGPLITPFFIEQWGYEGLMIYFMSICSIFILFMIWRRTQKAPPLLKDQQEFVAVPAPAGLIISKLDPRAKGKG
jgi:MFS family permease